MSDDVVTGVIPKRVFKPLYLSQSPPKSYRKCKCECSSPSYYRLRYQWYKRSLLERIFFVFILVALIAVIALSIAVYVLSRNKEVNVCLSKECVTTAGFILDSLDFSENPCENFQKFACGGFKDKSLVADQPLPDNPFGVSTVNIFTNQLKTFHARVKGLMEDPLNETYPKSMVKARNFYQSCMNKKRIEELDSHPLNDFLAGIGGWPVVVGADWNEQLFNWKDSLYRLSNHGFDSSLFFTISVLKDHQNPEKNILTIENPTVAIPETDDTYISGWWMENPNIVRYYHFMVNASVLFHANRTRAEEEMKNVVELEDKIAEFIFQSHLESPIRIPIKNLNEHLPQINWLEYFEKTLPFKLSGDEIISAEALTCIGKILDLIKHTPVRVVANFMIWRTVRYSLGHLSDKYRHLAAEYSPHILHEPDNPLWYTCLHSVWSSILTPAAVYVRKYLHTKDKEMVEEIVTVIRDELKLIVQKLHGLKSRHRQEAMDVLNSLDHYVFPDEFFDDEELDLIYSSLSFNDDEYFLNVFRVQKFLNDLELNELQHPANKPHWANIHFPFQLAYHLGHFYENTVEIPFSLLIGFNFDGNRPRYVNYATLTKRLGAQILELLPEEVRDKMFPDRDRCNLMQLKNPHISRIVSDSMEITAYLKLGYDAYKKWVDNHHEEKPLPGLHFTAYQLFWVTDATVYCAKYEKDASDQLLHDSRINIPPANLIEFARDFNCPLGSPMNLEEKCELF